MKKDFVFFILTDTHNSEKPSRDQHDRIIHPDSLRYDCSIKQYQLTGSFIYFSSDCSGPWTASQLDAT